MLISQVHPRSPAAQGGLQQGDVVLSIDGFTVGDSNAMRYRVATKRAGDMVSVRYNRDGATRTHPLRVALPPDDARDESTIDGPQSDARRARRQHHAGARRRDADGSDGDGRRHRLDR